MAINKIVSSFDEAVADVFDGAMILVGGFGNAVSMPSCLCEAIYRQGATNLITVSNNSGFGADIGRLQGAAFPEDMDILVRNGRVAKAIVSAPISAIFENNFEKLWRAGKIEREMVPQGTLAERIRAGKAGLGGVYIHTGVGTVVEEGKETKLINGRKYLLEMPIFADFAIIHAHKADRFGNLVYQGTSRTFNAVMAGAAKVTIAEVDEIVELGELDPEAIVTPGIYVQRVVQRPKPESTENEIGDELAKKAYGKIQADAKSIKEGYGKIEDNARRIAGK